MVPPSLSEDVRTLKALPAGASAEDIRALLDKRFDRRGLEASGAVEAVLAGGKKKPFRAEILLPGAPGVEKMEFPGLNINETPKPAAPAGEEARLRAKIEKLKKVDAFLVKAKLPLALSTLLLLFTRHLSLGMEYRRLKLDANLGVLVPGELDMGGDLLFATVRGHF